MSVVKLVVNVDICDLNHRFQFMRMQYTVAIQISENTGNSVKCNLKFNEKKTWPILYHLEKQQSDESCKRSIYSALDMGQHCKHVNTARHMCKVCVQIKICYQYQLILIGASYFATFYKTILDNCPSIWIKTNVFLSFNKFELKDCNWISNTSVNTVICFQGIPEGTWQCYYDSRWSWKIWPCCFNCLKKN